MKKTALKVVLILLYCLCANTKSYAQCNKNKFEALVKLGLKYAATSDFKNALNKYNAAKLVCSESSAYVDGLIEDIYSKIEEEKLVAEKAKEIAVNSRLAADIANKEKIKALKASLLQQKILQNHDSAFKLHIEANDLRERNNLLALQKERLANELYPNEYLKKTFEDIYSKTDHVYTKNSFSFDYQANLKFYNQGSIVLEMARGNPRLWNIDADTLITDFEKEIEFVPTAVDISPKMDKIAVAINGKPIYIYDRVKNVKKEYFGISYNADELYFTSNGNLILIERNSNSLELLNIVDSTLTFLPSFIDSNKLISDYAISDNGKFVAFICRSQNLYIWDINKNALVKGEYKVKGNRFLRFESDNQTILTFSDTGIIKFNLKGKVVRFVNDKSLKNASLFSFSGDGSYVYSSGFSLCFVNKFGDSTKFKCNDGFEGSGEGEVEGLVSLNSFESSKFILVKRDLYRLVLCKYSMIDLKQGIIEIENSNEQTQFSISNDGDLLFYSGDSTSSLYSVESGKKLWDINFVAGYYNSFEISPEWTFILIKEQDALVLRDMKSGEIKWKIKVDIGYPYQAAFLANGKMVVFSNSKLAMLLNVLDGKVISKKTFDYWSGPTILTCSPDSKFVFLVYQTFNEPDNLFLWDLKVDQFISLPRNSFTNFNKFSDNGKYLAYTDNSDSITYWPLNGNKSKYNYDVDFPNLIREITLVRNEGLGGNNYDAKYSSDYQYYFKPSNQYFDREANGVLLYDSTNNLLKSYHNIGCCLYYVPKLEFSTNKKFCAFLNDYEKKIYVVKVQVGFDEFLKQYESIKQEGVNKYKYIQRREFETNSGNAPPPPRTSR